MDADIQALLLQLERTTTGANCHTANKARMYLKMVAEKPKGRFSNLTRDQFIDLVRGAVYREEWKQLGDAMGRWW